MRSAYARSSRHSRVAARRMNGAISGAPRRACAKPGRSEWAIDGLDHRGARQPVGAWAEGSGVGFDDAARALAVDDAHHDGARLRAGELGDDRHAEPADVERHRHQEAVLLLG